MSGAWAETGTEKATKTGSKDTDLSGTSYTISGTYIAGAGSAAANGMANNGVKFRTGSDGNRLVFTVKSGYTITDFKLYGVSNYALIDGASEPCIAVTKVEIDEVEASYTGTGNFPAKGASDAGTVFLSDINASESIAIYFDNSNTSGTQINGYYEISWSVSDNAEAPIETKVTPTDASVSEGKTIQLIGSFTGGDFEGEWVSEDESIATVSNSGVVTGVSEGTTNITYQWAEDNSKDAYKATAIITVVEAFNASSLTVVKTYDFANWGRITLAIESTKAGSIYNAANSKNNDVFRCTNEGLESLAIQMVLSSKKGWTIDDNGLLEGSSAGRCAAICDVKEGQFIEFIHTSGNTFYTRNAKEDDGAKKKVLLEESGHHVYKLFEDGMVGFELTKGKYVTKVVIYEKNKTVTVTEAGYATFYSEYPVAIPSGVKAYSGTISGNYLVLSEVTGTIPAETAVVLEAAAGSYTFEPASAVEFNQTNDLKGGKVVVAANSVLVLSNVDGVPGFYTFEGTRLDQNKAYLDIPASSASGLRFAFEEVTGIATIKQEANATSVFDLAGRRTNAKGLVIKNGKVVLVK